MTAPNSCGANPAGNFSPALLAEVNATRAELGMPSLTAGLFGRFAGGLSPEELAEKAKRQLRDRFGRWKEERARLDVNERGEVMREPIRADSPLSSPGPALPRPSGGDTSTPDLPDSGWKERVTELRAGMPKPEDFGTTEMTLDYLPPRDRIDALRLEHDIESGDAVGWDYSALAPAIRRALGPDSGRQTPEQARAYLVGRRDRLLATAQAKTAEQVAQGARLPDLHYEHGEHDVPGTIAQAHLAAWLKLGHVLNDELERRIQAHGDDVRSEDEQGLLGFEVEDAQDALLLATIKSDRAARNGQIQAMADAQRDIGDGTIKWRKPEDVRVAALTEEDPVLREEARLVATAMDIAEPTQEMQLLRARGIEAAVKLERAMATWEESQTGRPVPGGKRYAQLQSEEWLKMLAEIRPVGGVLDMEADGHHSQDLYLAMDEASGIYPQDWMDRVEDGGPLTIVPSDRGQFNSLSRKIELSYREGESPDGLGGVFGRCAVHELGHAVEHAMPHIVMAERAMSHYRAPRDSETQALMYAPSETAGAPEYAYFDKWAVPYSGKVYPEALEILTTGMESLMAGSPYFIRPEELGGFDNEFRAFILALLATM